MAFIGKPGGAPAAGSGHGCDTGLGLVEQIVVDDAQVRQVDVIQRLVAGDLAYAPIGVFILRVAIGEIPPVARIVQYPPD